MKFQQYLKKLSREAKMKKMQRSQSKPKRRVRSKSAKKRFFVGNSGDPYFWTNTFKRSTVHWDPEA